MRLYWGIFTLVVLLVLASGCTTTQQMKNPVVPGTPVTTAIPTPETPPQYQIGDIVRARPESDIGFVVLDYNFGNKMYKVRFIFFDDFGQIYSVKYRGEEWVSRPALEQGYPYKSGRIDNPYAIAENKWITQPKFNNGDLVTMKDNPLQGVFIFEYNPKNNAYWFRYVEYSDYTWKFTGYTATYGNRGDIESKYTGSVYRVDPNSLPDPNK